MTARALRDVRAAGDLERNRDAMRTAVVATILAADILEEWGPQNRRRQAIVRRFWPQLGRVLDGLERGVRR
jgi:hypothetical protein